MSISFVVKSIQVLIIIAILSGMLMTGFYFGKLSEIQSERTDFPIERRLNAFSGSFQYTNPLLECNVNFNFFNTNSIESNLTAYIDKSKREGKLSAAGVYLRLLNNGSILGIQENDTFVSASLTKLPLAIAYGKLSELGELKFTDTITIPKDFAEVATRNIGQDTIKPGNTYTIEQLVREMLVNSDNTAAGILIQNIGLNKLNAIYFELGLPPVNIGSDDLVHISPKDISRFLRVLYNASYLNRVNSEHLLSYMGESSFKDGIRRGIPEQVSVANKFGEVGYRNSNEKQLHDCGIVYYSDNPYLLCVMTKGTDTTVLSGIITDISALVYQEISKMK